MPATSRTFRVFVSSTFEDLKEERNALQEKVFPALRKLCEQHGARFQAIDLRWGVRDEAALDQRTMEICLTEIERCQRTHIKPNFIILLGDRYGWRPLAARVVQREFDFVLSHITNPAHRTFVETWYRLDENAHPPEYVLLPRTGEFEDSSHWQTVETSLHQILRDAARRAGLSADDLIKYEASATHQEIRKGLGNTPEDRAHVFAFFHSGNEAGQDPELADLKVFLRKELGNNAIEFPHSGHTELCQHVSQRLEQIILKEIAGFESKPPLDLEIQAHSEFAQDRTLHFVGRESTLKSIADHLTGESRQPLVLHGESGSGKSAVIAKAAAAASASLPDAVVIQRFIGVTPGSSTGVNLLRSLCEQISQAYGQNQETPVGYEPLAAAFRDRLALATPERPLIVFVDALDQLPQGDPAASATWIPRDLATNAKIVVSTTGIAAALRNSPIVELPQLPVKNAEETLLERLQEVGRSLTSEQHDWLLSNYRRSGLPLYLKLAFEEARRWRSFTPLSQCRLGRDIAGVIDTLLDRLEDNSNHGRTFTTHSLGYLSAAKYGLTEDEMLDLLSADEDVWDDFRNRARHTPPEQRIPVVVWSRFYLDFEPYLTDRSAPGGSVIAFYHRQVAERILQRYFTVDVSAARHSAVAKYFRTQSHYSDDKHRQPNGRKAGELVHHFLGAGMVDEAVSALTDLDLVAASCASGLVFDLQRDYRNTIAVLPEAQEELAQEARREAEVQRWTHEIIEYARNADKGASLPRVIESVTPWTDEQIESKAKRIREEPTRLDRLRAFAAFVESECYPLIEFGGRPGFVLQHAFNSAPAGPVHDQARPLADVRDTPLLLRRWPGVAVYNPKPALLRTLEGHTEWVSNVSVTTDCRRAISASSDKTLRFWHLDSGACLRTLEGHTEEVNSVSVTPDGRRAVSASDDNTLRFWDLDSGACLRTLEGHMARVWSVSVTPDGRRAVSASSDKTLRFWDLDSGACLRTLEGHTDHVLSVSVTPDGRRAVSASSDETLRLWDLNSGTCIRTLEGHTGLVESVGVTPDGRRAVSASWDRTLRLWDLDCGACLRTFEGHTNLVGSVSVTPDGRRAISASSDKTLRFWDMDSGACLRTLEGHTSWVESVSVTPDGRRAVSASGDKTLRLWDLDSATCLPPLEGHAALVLSVTVTPDGRRAVTTSTDKTLRLWDLDSGARLHTLEGHTDLVLSVSVTPDGRRAVSASVDETLRLWDLNSGACLRTFEGHTAGVSGVSVTPDGRRAVSASYDKTLRLWDLESGACLRTLKGHTNWVLRVRVTPDGRRAVSASDDETLRLWDLNSGVCLRTLEGHTDRIWSVSVTLDGRRAVSTSFDKTLRLWDLESGACLRTLEGHTDRVSSVTVTPDGRRAVSTSNDNTLRLWDLESGVCLGILNGHPFCDSRMGVTPDGRRAVSASYDKTLRLWDLDSGDCLAVVRAPAPLVTAAFCVNGPAVLVVAGTGTGAVLTFEARGISF